MKRNQDWIPIFIVGILLGVLFGLILGIVLIEIGNSNRYITKSSKDTFTTYEYLENLDEYVCADSEIQSQYGDNLLFPLISDTACTKNLTAEMDNGQNFTFYWCAKSIPYRPCKYYKKVKKGNREMITYDVSEIPEGYTIKDVKIEIVK